MAATGWQAHTVRGTFAGAFKKKLGLNLISEKPAWRRAGLSPGLNGARDMEGFTNLTNAAREFIDARIEVVERNAFDDYTPEDVASVHREAVAIETEIARLASVVDAARAIARMRHPSIEKLLRTQGLRLRGRPGRRTGTRGGRSVQTRPGK
jgi:hypothetical protein